MKNQAKNKMRCLLFTALLLLSMIITSCGGGYPHHTIVEGRQLFVVYKVEKIDDTKYGTFKYAVTDASGEGWTLYSFQEFEIGDTLRISK